MPARIANSELVEVLKPLGIRARALCAGAVEVEGHPLQVASTAHPSPADAAELAKVADFVVADRLSAAARERLNSAGVGWLDRRGHVRIVRPGLIVDTDLPRLIPASARRGDSLGATGRDIAVTLLSDPGRPWGVNELARHLRRSPGRVSELLRKLRDDGLVTPESTPVVPELFWATADQWHPRWLPLSAPPEDSSGVLLSGGRAAVALGANLVLTADWPLELYVQDSWTLRHLAADAPAGRAKTVGAACPSPTALQLPSANKHKGFDLAHPVVIALDLAADRARGREVLDQWSPPGYARVW
ncbi:MAG: ArsR family transcriptional regulator [Acidimicrobiales bacterium]